MYYCEGLFGQPGYHCPSIMTDHAQVDSPEQVVELTSIPEVNRTNCVVVYLFFRTGVTVPKIIGR